METNVALVLLALLLGAFLEECAGRCRRHKNVPPNVLPKYRNRKRIVYFKCRRGYILIGTNYAICDRDKWSKDPPMCVASGCSEMKFDHNLLDVTYTYRGAVANFQCKAGYVMETKENRVYCNKYTWNKAAPKCLKAALKKSCDFENGLCGWTQDYTDNFDWTRHSLDTNTKYTGPSRDHTYGDMQEGYYMYIEASSPQRSNDKARLLSPIFPATRSGKCLEFWYHMWCPSKNKEPGVLEVFIRPLSQPFNDTQRIFNETGDHGNMWNQVKLQLSKLSESFQIVIQGTRKMEHQNDIAVDDIRLWQTACNDSTGPWGVSSGDSIQIITTSKSILYSRITGSVPSVAAIESLGNTTETKTVTTTAATITGTERIPRRPAENVTTFLPTTGGANTNSESAATTTTTTATTTTTVMREAGQRTTYVRGEIKTEASSSGQILPSTLLPPSPPPPTTTTTKMTENWDTYINGSSERGNISTGNVRERQSTKGSEENYTPLAIGITVALLFGVTVIFFIVWLWARNQDKKRSMAEYEEETHPITGSNSSLQNGM